MTRILRSPLRRLAADETGVVVILLAFSFPFILGFAALAIDYGYFLYVEKKLQASTDAAALAGAQGLNDGTYLAKADLYSSSATAGGINTITGVTVSAPAVTTKCSTTMENAGVACITSAGNVIQVTQTANVPPFFGSAIHLLPQTISATATASAAGGNFPALNVMIVIDTTQSMNDTDPLCNETKIACALSGVQSILTQVYPSIDYVGLLVFPGVTSASAADDINCNANVSPVEYGISGFSGTSPTDTYTIVGLSTCTLGSSGSCYRTSNSTTSLNSSNSLVKAVGNSGTSTSACTKAIGGDGTYYADAINQAQSDLAAFKTSLGTAGANTQNVIVFLSDGDANAKSGTQIVTGEATNQCHEGITAAASAAAAGTWVYVIGYAPVTSGGCTTDSSPSITPYCTLMEIASNLKFFYSDTAPPSSACPNGDYGPAASANVKNIFSQIGASLSSVRLIPNTTS